MIRRLLLVAGCLLAVAAAAWVGGSAADKPAPDWETVYNADGLTIRRSPTAPAAYLLEAGGSSLLIDAPVALKDIKPAPAKLTAVLLTHHHRDTVSAAADYIREKIPVRASPEAAEWLEPKTVAKFWEESIPLRSSRTAYFVVPVGIDGITYDLKDGTRIPLGEWSVNVIATPGHSRDHLAFAARRGEGPPLVFCGDAVTGEGKLWTPFTTDWDHWTDAGLKPAAASIRKMAALEPAVLFPARGPVVREQVTKRLDAAAIAVEEVAFLKSFERFTNRLGNPPQYDFLVPKEQVGSGGDKPWAKISDHLWITGNTYVLASKDKNACFVLDPWGSRSAKQIEKLREDEKLGPIELIAFSHAHYDHYDGIYDLKGRASYQVWALDKVAGPLETPFNIRAPFLDARPIHFDKKLADGDTATWREYTFRFRHFPGQSEFTSGIETTIDGKKCFFTADNFFHQAQYSGSGGWMGLNRSFPPKYAASAKVVLAAAPDWILAEHGGPYVFNAEDYKRRVSWGDTAGKAADAVSPTGKHIIDWNPHRTSNTPVRIQPRAGEAWVAILQIEPDQPPLHVLLNGRGIIPDQVHRLSGGQAITISIQVPKTLPVGRHVFAIDATDAEGHAVADPYLVLDVIP